MRLPKLAVLLALLALPGALAAASLDDAVTSLKVRTVLLEKFGTDALGIKIDVASGNVVLSGSVDQSQTRDGAKAAAREVKGVSSVEERLTVGNGPATKTRSASRRAKTSWENSILETRVKARLFEQVGENALKIRVEAKGTTVTLEGTVPTGNVRSTALDTVRATKGVSRVVERLAVGQKAG
jgi:hyperosmotically inducible periplasmic protein